jgi:threonine dehydrogenase-like Zn-dependent dehydrogenase
MKAVVYKGPFDVAVEEVPDPRIEHPSDVIVRVTSTAICGSDLHMYEGRTAAEPGIVVSHELPLEQAPEAYEKFDKRVEGCTNVVLHPGS